MMKFIFHIVSLFLVITQFNGVHASTKKIDPFEAGQIFQFSYQITVPKMPIGKKISLWVPYPIEDLHQKILKFYVDSPFPWELNEEQKFGNKIIYTEWLSTGKIEIITYHYKIMRSPSVGVHRTTNLDGTLLDPKKYKKASLSLPITSEIKNMANEQVKGIKSKHLKIRAIYDHTVNIMSYNKEGVGWGKGDPVWACSTKRGNCTDFHSLYIALARTQGIAARFKIGFPLPNHLNKSNIPGYHCWAEVFDPTIGWMPLDASEAKKSGLKSKYFGKLPSDRILFSIGRDLILEPPQKNGPINYFIYPYAEVDGKKTAEIKRELSFNRLKLFSKKHVQANK